MTYEYLTNQEYYRLTQFSNPKGREAVSEFIKQRNSGSEVQPYRVEISKDLAFRILEYIRKDSLNTRGPVPDVSSLTDATMSDTIYTIHFALHFVAGKRGGWFILEDGGREPIIKDEFISYGPMRKSGTRKHRYRRKLSYSEQNQVDYLKSITPPFQKIFDWVLNKYPIDIKNLEFY